MGSFRDAYRPEQHYMRGPGPKWHAKHTSSLFAAASAQRMANSGAYEHACPGEASPRPGAVGVWVAPTAAVALLGFVAVMVLS